VVNRDTPRASDPFGSRAGEDGDRFPRPLVGVVADDITGAGDIGVMFAKHGYAVRIFGAETDLDALPGRLVGRRTDVIIIDTDSRMDQPSVAYEKVRRATAALIRAGCGLFWKKTCSVFRGNVGPEFDALFDELNHRFALAVAAFPKNGRITRGGVHYVHGRLLAESEFARDPVHPRTESNLVVDLQRQTSRKVGLIALDVIRRGPQAIRSAVAGAQVAGVAYALCDAETQEDLAQIARAAARERVLLGSSSAGRGVAGGLGTGGPVRASGRSAAGRCQRRAGHRRLGDASDSCPGGGRRGGRRPGVHAGQRGRPTGSHRSGRAAGPGGGRRAAGRGERGGAVREPARRGGRGPGARRFAGNGRGGRLEAHLHRAGAGC
jgi:Protein of unknown function, DUF1537.